MTFFLVSFFIDYPHSVFFLFLLKFKTRFSHSLRICICVEALEKAAWMIGYSKPKSLGQISRNAPKEHMVNTQCISH